MKINKNKFLTSFDFILLLSSILLTIIGIFFIYSANFSKSSLSTEFIKQIIFFIISLILLLIIIFTPLKNISESAIWFYIVLIFGLIITLFFPSIKGQRRLNLFGISIQFSEFMKIATIMLLSLYYSKRTKEELKKITTYLKGLFIVIIPVVLILLQPDLGTVLVYVPIFLIISFIAGIKKRYILFSVIFIFSVTLIPVLTSINELFFNNENEIIFLLTNVKYIVILFGSLLFTILIALIGYLNIVKSIDEKFRIFFYWYLFFCSAFLIGISFSYPLNYKVLKQYQKDRLMIFFNPEFDPKGRGFHIIQSKNTIGNGGIFGKGWTKGELTQNYFLPEQATDFIYPVIAEELGFIGSFLILFLYAIFLYRGLKIAITAKDYWSSYVVVGILTMICFHIFQNMGMCLGIMPITGIPLPFLSYGGSFLMSCFMGVGLILKIGLNRFINY